MDALPCWITDRTKHETPRAPKDSRAQCRAFRRRQTFWRSRASAELKRSANQNGRSLEGELRVILSHAARPRQTEMIAEADRVDAMTPGPLEDSVLLLRQDRDSR